MGYNHTMSTQGKHYEPNGLERALFGLIGALHTLIGLYAVSPLYLSQTQNSDKPTLYTLFASDDAVKFYGAILLISGICLLWSTFARANQKWYFSVVTNALFVGFLIRFYALFGTLLLSESWRPPTWISPFATVLITGTLYVWIRLRERFTT